VPWDTPGEAYSIYANRLLKTLTEGHPPPLLTATAKFTEIEYLDAIRPATGVDLDDRCVRFLASSQSDRHVSLEVMYGIGGRFTHVMGPSGDESIDGQAAARQYRAELFLPPDPSDIEDGVLAVETIARTAPVGSLRYWLAAASKAQTQTTWWHLRCNQVTDTDFLDELIDRAESAEVVLKHRASDGIGNAEEHRYTLRAPLQTGRRRDARNWAKNRARTKDGLLHIIGVDDSGDLEFDDGWISLSDGDTSTKIGLSDAREIFTYPTSPTRPDDATWQRLVRNRVRQIRPKLDSD
jgi:hypothetical protein